MRLITSTPLSSSSNLTPWKARTPARRTLTPAYERPPNYKTAAANVLQQIPTTPPPPATPLTATPCAGAEWDCQFVDVWGCTDSDGETPATPTLEASVFGHGTHDTAAAAAVTVAVADAAAAASGTIYREFAGFSPQAPCLPRAGAAGNVARPEGCTFLGNCACADCAEDTAAPALARASTLAKIKAGRVSQLSSMFQ